MQVSSVKRSSAFVNGLPPGHGPFYLPGPLPRQECPWKFLSSIIYQLNIFYHQHIYFLVGALVLVARRQGTLTFSFCDVETAGGRNLCRVERNLVCIRIRISMQKALHIWSPRILTFSTVPVTTCQNSNDNHFSKMNEKDTRAYQHEFLMKMTRRTYYTTKILDLKQRKSLFTNRSHRYVHNNQNKSQLQKLWTTKSWQQNHKIISTVNLMMEHLQEILELYHCPIKCNNSYSNNRKHCD